MATVLMGWELGGGLGHVKRLLDISGPLAARGHRVVFAVRNLIETAPLLDGLPFVCVQAPYFRRASGRPRDFQAASYADILAVCGFAGAADLLPLVRAWQGLLDLTQPRLIVADHSPTLCLAAFGALPVINVGNGFLLPPVDEEAFPPLHTGSEPVVSQDQLLRVVRQVQQQRGRKLPATLPQLLAETERFILTWPELDPYRDVRRDKMWGPCPRYPRPEPRPAQPRFFAYLGAEYPAIAKILPILIRNGFTGGAFIRGAPLSLRQELRAANVQVHDQPVPISLALADCSLLVHHAGLGTVEAGLAAGRPQLMLPRHLEQRSNARALAALGAGRQLSGRVLLSQVPRAARQLHAADVQQRAMELAHQFHERSTEDGLQGVIDRCLVHLESP